MPQTWAASRPDLFVELDRHRVRASLEISLRNAIRTGRLHPGTTLPPSRVLAADLSIARNTVVDVYGQLVAEGWLNATSGSHTTVAGRAAPTPAPGTVTPADTAAPASRGYDLRGGLPDTSAFPRQAWLSASRRALQHAPTQVFGYQDPRGRTELRHALADYLSRVRGVYVHADQVVICLGAMHGLRLIGKALRHSGATVWATESYGLAWHRQAAMQLGFQLKIVPIDEQGAQVDQFGDASSVMLSPAHQFPLGMALTPARRREAVEWAKTTHGIIIEDDYDGEFRHDRRPIGALQSLAPEQVIYVGTASKSLAPALRLGWMVVPPHLLSGILEAKSISEGHNSTLDQLTLAEFIRSGDYDRHVRRSRLRYRHRRDQLTTMVGEFTELTMQGIAAGMHALIELPDQLAEAPIVEYAQHRGLILEGLSLYAADPAQQQRPPALVIGYGAPSDASYTATLDQLEQTLRHFTKSTRTS